MPHVINAHVCETERTDADELLGDEVRVFPDVSVNTLGQQNGVEQSRVRVGLPQHLHQTYSKVK